ncbi:hypothetical protein [Streptomyces sp. 1222.5]|uniref:hypothetical protein n=1 Tax=Streptomyces sp. 1222.5 TaxID=1881026 RepID=UPI003D717873
MPMFTVTWPGDPTFTNKYVDQEASIYFHRIADGYTEPRLCYVRSWVAANTISIESPELNLLAEFNNCDGGVIDFQDGARLKFDNIF